MILRTPRAHLIRPLKANSALAYLCKVTPGGKVMPVPALDALVRRRGRPSSDLAAKVLVSVRLAPEVLTKLRASGPGWQTRVVEAVTRLADGLGNSPSESVNMIAPNSAKAEQGDAEPNSLEPVRRGNPA